jgi:hypothetical protein
MVEATIEDLASPVVPRENLTESDGDVVLSTTFPKDSKYGKTREQRLQWKSLGIRVRSSASPRRATKEWR